MFDIKFEIYSIMVQDFLLEHFVEALRREGQSMDESQLANYNNVNEYFDRRFDIKWND